MNRSIILSSALHLLLIFITAMSLPFLAKKPIDLPPIVSVELIQITEKTNIPFAPKAKKIIEKVKEKEKKLVSEQAPPKKVKKKKPDAIPLPDEKVNKIEKIKDEKQNPEKIDNEVKQVSEFEKKELFDPNNIAALIDKSKIESSEVNKQSKKVTQDQERNVEVTGLSLSEEDALKAQIFGCWSIPLGLPFNENLLVRIRLQLDPDGSVTKSEILDHARMNKPGQGFYKVLAESALRAIKLCQPLRVPTTGYERWKELQLNFDAREMLEG
ncbi:MAG: cell envelope biogenesis protein TolA [Pelagibacterales bacterium MED-G42]|nr:MAG: cell envelope biogenesis protein TolA [Pelagibacterales bacterium MED-G42]